MIPDHILESVRAATDLPQLAREYGLALKAVAGGFISLCPFHKEETPSFRINTLGERRGYFHCFGCSKSGNAYEFLMAIGNLNFPQAVELLADRAGIQITPERRTPVQRVTDAEDIACSRFWWQQRWEAARSLLDDALAENDYPLARCAGRLLRHIESLSQQDRLQTFRCEVTSVDRAEWRAVVAEDKAFYEAWMSLAVSA